MVATATTVTEQRGH